MKVLFLSLALTAVALHAEDLREGMWQGFDGEWVHVSRQLIVLAEAIPAEKFTWRPAEGVRSMSEVYMHIALTNFDLLSVTGPKMPADITSDDMEKTVTTKADVIAWLKRSIEAVKTARAAVMEGSGLSGKYTIRCAPWLIDLINHRMLNPFRKSGPIDRPLSPSAQ